MPILLPHAAQVKFEDMPDNETTLRGPIDTGQIESLHTRLDETDEMTSAGGIPAGPFLYLYLYLYLYKPLRCLPIVITEPIQRSRRHLSTRV